MRTIPVVLIVVALGTRVVRAAEPELDALAGSWKLSVELGEEVEIEGRLVRLLTPTMTLRVRDGKLTGGVVEPFRQTEVPFTMVAVDGDRVTATLKHQISDYMVEAVIAGERDGDTIVGELTYDAGFGKSSLEFLAERIPNAEVAGQWTLRIETGNGPIELDLDFDQGNSAITGTIARDESKTELESVAVEGNRLHFTVRGRHQGKPVTARVAMTVRGDTLRGELHYQLGDQSGAVPVRGKRKQST